MKRAMALVVMSFAVAMSCWAQTPHPALLVLNKGANELAIVDPAKMEVLGRIPVGEGPHEVATDGKLAFVANFGARTPGNTLSVIDLATEKEIKRVDLGKLQRPHGILVRNGVVYFTSDDTTNQKPGSAAEGAVNRYDFKTGIISTIPTGQSATHMLVLSNDGKTIFASNIRSNSVSVVEGHSVTTVPVGKGPEGIDISPAGREVWVAHSQDGGISIIDTNTKKVTQTLSIGTKRSNRLKFTPDGKRVFVSDLDGGEVVVLDAASRKEVKRVQTGGHPEGILMLPDGSKVLVAIANEGAIAVIDPKTFEIKGKYPTGPDADGMAWVK